MIASDTHFRQWPEDLSLLTAAFDLGKVQELHPLTNGLMNRNWRLVSDRGTFALKQVVDVPLPTMRRNLDAVVRLAGDGIPVCPPVPSFEGELVVEVQSRGYCLFPWRRGDHVAGTELPLDQVHGFGALLGRIHRGLNRTGPNAALPEPPEGLSARVIDPAEARAEADRFLAAIASNAHPEPFDTAAEGWLRRRKRLLDQHGHLRPAADKPIGPIGWTHGDVQHLNLIWRGGRVVAVLDWDRIRVRTFGEEVARTATLMFGGEQGHLDLTRVAGFVAGYRTVVPLPEGNLTDAVQRLWWKRMSDYWHLVFHYDRGDHSCDHLYHSAEQLLHWWTAHRDEVQAAFAGPPDAPAVSPLAATDARAGTAAGQTGA